MEKDNKRGRLYKFPHERDNKVDTIPAPSGHVFIVNDLMAPKMVETTQERQMGMTRIVNPIKPKPIPNTGGTSGPYTNPVNHWKPPGMRSKSTPARDYLTGEHKRPGGTTGYGD